MQRRAFLKNTAFSVVAVSAFGFIRFDGNGYVGDCETTTDILGPYYRPGSPVRNNLVVKGVSGDLVELTGTIRHNDCTTPYKKAKVELWHCGSDGVYDNTTAAYRYRGTTFTDNNGNYSFNTILPVPYDAGGGHIRPAHFHLMITAAGYQPLVTQLYFSGDPHISKDPYSASPMAKKRILEVQKLKNGHKKVLYDVSMAERLEAHPSVIDKLIGVYVDEKDKTKKTELFKKNNLLWMKNEVFGKSYQYSGNNTFEYPGMPPGMYARLSFEIMPSGSIKLTKNYIDADMVKHIDVSIKK